MVFKDRREIGQRAEADVPEFAQLVGFTQSCMVILLVCENDQDGRCLA
jgi:hypothetical protein